MQINILMHDTYLSYLTVQQMDAGLLTTVIGIISVNLVSLILFNLNNIECNSIALELN